MSFSPINLLWAHLVHYCWSADCPIKYGKPVSRLNADLGKLASKGELQVKQLLGSDSFSLQTTSIHETVFHLYGSLEVKDVPIIQCISLNYKTHSNWLSIFLCPQHVSIHMLLVPKTSRPLPTCPTIFTKPGPAVVDHNTPVPIPKIAQNQCNYKSELVVVIRCNGKNIFKANALDYVTGYTTDNHVSARDWQHEAGFSPLTNTPFALLMQRSTERSQ